MENNVEMDFDFARELVLRAGEFVRVEMKGGYETEWKSDNTPVTSIDLSVSKLVIDEVHQKYPDDRIFGEEESVGGSSRVTWVLDPIDGTQAMGIVPTSTICLARVDANGKPLFGLVYNPTTDELFSAKRGEVSTCNDTTIKVSLAGQLKGGYVFLGSRMPESVASNGVVYDRLESQGAKLFNTRSLAFGCVMVALGKAVGAYIGVRTPFEAAAVTLIIEGAGGKVTDLFGAEPSRFDAEIQGLVVSNGLVHDALLAALKA